VTLRWREHVMTVWINDHEVGSISTDSASQNRSPHHMRFCMQFWQENDQVVLKSYDGVLTSCESTPRAPDKRKPSKPSKSTSGTAVLAADAKRSQSADAGAHPAEGADPAEAKKMSYFTWGYIRVIHTCILNVRTYILD
jgi:hypothetical protein